MANINRLGVFVWFLIVCSVSMYGQQRNLQINGVVYDKELKEEIAQATIQLLALPDSVMEKGTISDLEGKFLLKGGIRPKPYLLKISFIGYKPLYIAVDPKNGVNGKIDLGKLILKSDAILLEGATVTAEAAKVSISGDTITFNTSAYRVPQNAMLEELVKKLPGAQVDQDGKITINGKEISKIMIDGKEFFAKDPNIAMKNLPIDIIDKVKSYDKKSDQARITGIDDGEEETVLDLAVKKDMNKGWFGNADVGIGTHDRYVLRGMLNRFNDGDQLTGMFNFNNIRDSSIGGGGRWFRQNGVEELKSGGINFGLKRDKIDIGGSISYGERETDRENRTTSETFLVDQSSFSKGFSNSLSRSRGLNSDLRIEWRPDSMTTILYTPSVELGDTKTSTVGESKTGDLDDFENWDLMLQENRAINSKKDRSFSKGDDFSTDGSLIFNRKLGKKGRNIGFDFNYGIGKSSNSGESYSLIEYYKRENNTDPVKKDERSLLTDNDNSNNSLRFKVNYSEPIAKNRFLQFSYGYERSYNSIDRKTYNLLDWDTAGGEQPIDDYLDKDLSKDAKNYYDSHDVDIKMNTIKEKYSYNIGFSVQPQRNRMKYQQGIHNIDTVRSVINFSPIFDYRYKFSKQTQLRIMYRGRTSQPSMTNLLPIRDETNPLNIREGNPGLKPSYNNMFRLFFNGFMPKKQQSFMVSVFFRNTINSVSSRVTYDPSTGGRVTKPENINGNWNLGVYGGFNTPFKNKKFTLSNFANYRYNNIVGYISLSKEDEAKKNRTGNLTAGDNLTLNYRNDWFELGLLGSISYTRVKNSLQSQSNRETFDYGFGLNSNIQLPWDLSFATDIAYNIRKGYSQGVDKNEVIWNAQLSKSFLKQKQATVTIQMFDILKQRSNLSRSISASMRTDTEYNDISNFFMVHFVYKLNTFGGRKGDNSSKSPRRGRHRVRSLHRY